MEEADVDMCTEGVDVPEWSIFHTQDGTAIVEQFSHVRATVAQASKPKMRKGTEFARPSGEPRSDFGIVSG